MTSTNASDLYGSVDTGRLTYPIIGGSVSEAVFMTGLERNSDIVFAASYAPLLGVSDPFLYLQVILIAEKCGWLMCSMSTAVNGYVYIVKIVF